MSKQDGWAKHSYFEWRKSGETFRAEVTKVTGGVVPYYWDVYPLPRADHIGADGRYRPIARGSERTLAEAKAAADAIVAAHVTAIA